MKTILTLTCFALAGHAAFGQDTFASRVTAGVTIVSTQSAYRDYSANPFGFGLEVTFDITRNPENALNFRGFFNYFTVSGKDREVVFQINTAAQTSHFGSSSLNGMTLGADVTFKTPWKKIAPYAGLMLTKWSGSHSGFENLTEQQLEYDGAVKFGWRVGVDYTITKNVILGAGFNLSEWRSNRDYAATGTSNPVISRGWNPVNPSWANITGRWRF
jgi:hypothetical protein